MTPITMCATCQKPVDGDGVSSWERRAQGGFTLVYRHTSHTRADRREKAVRAVKERR